MITIQTENATTIKLYPNGKKLNFSMNGGLQGVCYKVSITDTAEIHFYKLDGENKPYGDPMVYLSSKIVKID